MRVGCSGRCRRSPGAAREIRDVGFSDFGAYSEFKHLIGTPLRFLSINSSLFAAQEFLSF